MASYSDDFRARAMCALLFEPVADVARALHISRSTAYSWRHDARQLLRAELRAEGFDIRTIRIQLSGVFGVLTRKTPPKR